MMSQAILKPVEMACQWSDIHWTTVEMMALMLANTWPTKDHSPLRLPIQVATIGTTLPSHASTLTMIGMSTSPSLVPQSTTIAPAIFVSSLRLAVAFWAAIWALLTLETEAVALSKAAGPAWMVSTSFDEADPNPCD